MATHGTKSGPGDEQLIVELASGASHTEACQRTGCSRSTLYRRLRCEAFRQRVTSARGELLQATLDRLTAAAGDALTNLVQLCGAGEHADRLEACRLTLTNWLTRLGQNDVLAKLDGLEKHLREKLP